jgi:hypothetical protein
MMQSLELLDWEDKVIEWDVCTDALTLLYLQEVDTGPAGRITHTPP